MKTKLTILFLTVVFLLACSVTPRLDAETSFDYHTVLTPYEPEPTPWVTEGTGRKAGP